MCSRSNNEIVHTVFFAWIVKGGLPHAQTKSRNSQDSIRPEKIHVGNASLISATWHAEAWGSGRPWQGMLIPPPWTKHYLEDLSICFSADKSITIASHFVVIGLSIICQFFQGGRNHRLHIDAVCQYEKYGRAATRHSKLTDTFHNSILIYSPLSLSARVANAASWRQMPNALHP